MLKETILEKHSSSLSVFPRPSTPDALGWQLDPGQPKQYTNNYRQHCGGVYISLIRQLNMYVNTWAAIQFRNDSITEQFDMTRYSLGMI